MKQAIKNLLKPAARFAPSALQRWWYGHVDLHIDLAQFSRFSDRLKPCMAKVATTRFHRPAEYYEIPGWITHKERQTLYALAKWLPGPITEIGSWVGLSTTAIARGVRDSGENKDFTTYDLKLTEDLFRHVDGGIGLFLDGDKTPHGICSEESYQREILPVLRTPGGSNGLLKKNLANYGLTKFASINVGNFRSFPPITSGFLFCDTLHDECEIELNAPELKPWLRSGSILACHDVGGSPRLIEKMRQHVALGYGVAVDSLYVAEVL